MPFIDELYGDEASKVSCFNRQTYTVFLISTTSQLSVRRFEEAKDEHLDMIIPTGYHKFLQKYRIRSKVLLGKYNCNNKSEFRLLLGADYWSKPLTNKVYFNSEVVEVNALNNPNLVHVVTRDSLMAEADAVIVTASLGVLKSESIKFVPELTKEHLIAIRRIGK